MVMVGIVALLSKFEFESLSPKEISISPGAVGSTPKDGILSKVTLRNKSYI